MAFAQRFQEIRAGFQPTFWVANITELFERLSYYGVNRSTHRGPAPINQRKTECFWAKSKLAVNYEHARSKY